MKPHIRFTLFSLMLLSICWLPVQAFSFPYLVQEELVCQVSGSNPFGLALDNLPSYKSADKNVNDRIDFKLKNSSNHVVTEGVATLVAFNELDLEIFAGSGVFEKSRLNLNDLSYTTIGLISTLHIPSLPEQMGYVLSSPFKGIQKGSCRRTSHACRSVSENGIRQTFKSLSSRKAHVLRALIVGDVNLTDDQLESRFQTLVSAGSVKDVRVRNVELTYPDATHAGFVRSQFELTFSNQDQSLNENLSVLAEVEINGSDSSDRDFSKLSHKVDDEGSCGPSSQVRVKSLRLLTLDDTP